MSGVPVVKMGQDTSAALEGFSQRVGVPREQVLLVMVGLAEAEKQERSGMLASLRLLLECQEFLRGNVKALGLCSRIEKTLDDIQMRSIL